MLRRFAFSLLIVSSILFTNALQAQVTASLVAPETSIQPGRPITVALRLVHEPHWHTYWINAGTGYPTSLTWQLPEGWTASEIQWPAPITIKDATGLITGNGYEGEILLPVTLTPPANLKPGEAIALRAKAEWLMCKETCIPGQAEVALTLPVSNETPTTDKSVRDTLARLPVPKPPVGWKITATQSAKTITLTLVGSNAPLANPRFFSTDALIQYDEPQPVTTTADSVRLVLPISPSFEGKPTKLLGVLSYGESAEQRRGLSIDASLAAAPAPTSPQATTSLLPTLLLAFVGGLILNLMPCVFPVLGIKILGFVNQAGSDRRKVTLHGIVFALGVLASFWVLGGLLVTVWQGAGWGTQLQHPEVNFTIAAVFLIFALSLSGVFEIGLSATRVGNVVASKSGLFATFLEGAFITVVATPCSAPFLGTAIGAALTTLPAAQAMLVFTCVAIGLATPYLLLSIFPAGVKFLPRPGVWMETFKQAMAFPVYAAVGYFVWILVPQVKDEGHLNVIFGLTLVAMAAWLYGRYTVPGSKPARVRFAFIGGAILLGSGALLGWPRAAAATDIVWEKWSPAAVASAQAEGKTIYVDFTARWCATCQANKRLVFGSDEVKRLFRERSIVTLKGDWTNHDPAITAELVKYGRSAVPFNLIYKPSSPEPVALPELLTPSIVLETLR